MNDRLLAATYQRLVLLQNDEQYTLDEGNGPYFGMTWNKHLLYVGARRWDTSKNEAIQVYNRRLELVETYVLRGVDQLHQIYWHDGLIYVTNTLHDRVMVTDLNGRLDTVYHADAELAERDGDADRHHINSLWCDGEHFYIAELHGAIKVFTLGWQLTKTISLPYELHGVYVEDGNLYTCASNAEAVVRLSSDEYDLELIKVGGYLGVMQDAGDLYQAYTRGIARTGERWYIGASAIQDEREARATGDSAILEFDNDWQFIESIRLPDTGQLNGVRVLGNDRAHGGAIWR